MLTSILDITISDVELCHICHKFAAAAQCAQYLCSHTVMTAGLPEPEGLQILDEAELALQLVHTFLELADALRDGSQLIILPHTQLEQCRTQNLIFSHS